MLASTTLLVMWRHVDFMPIPCSFKVSKNCDLFVRVSSQMMMQFMQRCVTVNKYDSSSYVDAYM